MSEKEVRVAIKADASSFRAEMRESRDALGAVAAKASATEAAMGKLGASARNSSQHWSTHRREIEATYVALGKTPSKEVVAQLDDIEKKFNSLADAAQSGNKVAQNSLRGLLADARKATKDDMLGPVQKPEGMPQQWSTHRREIEATYAALGKTPSKEVVAQLDDIEKKFNSLADAAQSGNQVAQSSLSGLLADSRKASKDDMLGPDQKPEGLLERIRGKAGAAAAVMGTLAAASAAVAVVGNVRAQIDYADALDDMAQKAGTSAKELSTLTYATNLEGIENEKLTKTLADLSAKLVDASTGGASSAAVFRTLGIAVKDQDGHVRNSVDVLMDLSERFAAMPDGAEKAGLAIAVLGKKAGPDLIPFLNRGRDGIEELREEARKLGLELSNETAAAAGDFNDNLTRLSSAGDGVFRQMATALLPTLVVISEALVAGAKEGGALSIVFDGVALVFKGLALAGSGVWTQLKLIGLTAVGVASAVGAAVKGNFTGAKQHLVNLQGELEKTVQAHFEFSKKLLFGEAPKPNAPTVPRRPPPDLSELKAVNATSRVSKWEGELDRQKLAHERMNVENGTFIAFSMTAERDFWANILRVQGMSADERLAVEKKHLAAFTQINRTVFDAQQADQRRQLDDLGKDFAARAELAQAMALQTRQRYGEQSKEYAEARARIEAIERDHQDQLDQLTQLGHQRARGAAEFQLQSEQQDAQLSFQLGQINREQLLQLDLDFNRRRYEIEREALVQAKQLIDPQKDPVAYEKQLQQLLELERKHALQRRQVQGELKVMQDSPLGNVFAEGGRQFSSMASGILTRAQSLKQALASVFSGIYGVFMSEMITKPLAAEAMKFIQTTGLYQALFGVQVATQTAASGAVTGVKAAETTAVVTANAAQAASGAAASQAPIPVIGPGLAIGAAAMMMALVLGMKSSVPSAAGGYDIPAGVNPLTQLHEEEMVLPATYANTIRRLASMQEESVAAPARAGDTYQFSLSFIDKRGVDSWLRRNAGGVAGAVKDHIRKNGK